MTDAPAQQQAENEGAHGTFVRRGLGLAGGVLVLDQLTKWVILDVFADGTRVIEVLPVFNLVLTWNRGISFGLFGGAGGLGPWILTGLAVVIAAVLGRWLTRTDSRWTALGLGLLIGGAIGNVIDRVRFGAVVDFLDVHVSGYHWPAFNVADSAITVGAAILIIESLFSSQETP